MEVNLRVVLSELTNSGAISLPEALVELQSRPSWTQTDRQNILHSLCSAIRSSPPSSSRALAKSLLSVSRPLCVSVLITVLQTPAAMPEEVLSVASALAYALPFSPPFVHTAAERFFSSSPSLFSALDSVPSETLSILSIAKTLSSDSSLSNILPSIWGLHPLLSLLQKEETSEVVRKSAKECLCCAWSVPFSQDPSTEVSQEESLEKTRANLGFGLSSDNVLSSSICEISTIIV